MKKTIFLSLLSLVGAVGCSSSDDECSATYNGNYSGSITAPSGCGTIAASENTPGDQALKFDITTKGGITLAAQFDIGATPITGALTSEEVLDWQAIGSANNDCQYAAGAMATPAGNFSLTLTSLPSNADGAAHGTLHVEQFVQNPPGSDCGPGDTEVVDLMF